MQQYKSIQEAVLAWSMACFLPTCAIPFDLVALSSIPPHKPFSYFIEETNEKYKIWKKLMLWMYMTIEMNLNYYFLSFVTGSA